MYFVDHYSNVSYPIKTSKKQGLRNAQLGAIHALASFETLGTSDAAIIVMPTGAGKTAILMMAPYLLKAKKVLIVTPSTLVRGQITEDFAELRTLINANVFYAKIKKPCVFEMEHLFDENMLTDLTKADVIVASARAALSLSETAWAKNNISLVEIDEAHHVPAKTWTQILLNLSNAKHVLYTATPFRMDKKELLGDIIYNYPLSKAYEDGIFGEIQYIPIEAYENKDIAIAKKAEEVFYNDKSAGFEHFLMVRTDTKEKAKDLQDLYENNTTLKLRRIDSSMTNTYVKKCITDLRESKIDGIICVDMLGEGFDFPNLKIAAIHVPHKSLANTLQFIGRFARTNADKIGTAKFIAVDDEEFQIENQRLYSTDAIWQDIIIDLSEGKNNQAKENKEYYKNFEGKQSEREDYIPINDISLNCHTKIYKAIGFDINSVIPDEFNVAERVYRNTEDATVVAIGLEHFSPKWLEASHKINKEYTLYVIHYQAAHNLLYIYSQVHSEKIYDELAESFVLSYDKISRSEINKVLGEMSGFEIFNSGLASMHKETGEAYRIMAGPDVASSIDPDTGQMYSAGHVYCKATTIEGEEITIGYSSGSKVWSSSYYGIRKYTQWCDWLGNKISKSNIQVKTNTNFDLIPKAERLTEYPDNVYFIDFDKETYVSSPIVLNADGGVNYRLTDFSILVKRIKKDQIVFKVFSDQIIGEYSCGLDGKYNCISEALSIKFGLDTIPLSEYFNEYPLSFQTTDDAIIEGTEIVKAPTGKEISFNQECIEPIDWEKYGTDIKVEFSNNSNVESIQNTLKKILIESNKYSHVLYDHGSGEMADFIAFYNTNNEWIACLYHVKKMSAASHNSSVNDIYEVVGQANKSVSWFSTKGKFIEKMLSRHKSSHCQDMVGSFEELITNLKSPEVHLSGVITVVQPALSKTIKMDDKIQRVLAATANYINHSSKVKNLRILGSK